MQILLKCELEKPQGAKLGHVLEIMIPSYAPKPPVDPLIRLNREWFARKASGTLKTHELIEL